MANGACPKTFSDTVYRLCTSGESVSSLLAADPNLPPGDAWDKLYKHHSNRPKSSHAADDVGKGDVSKEDLERAAKCGNWGPTQPSELFLRLYHDALGALEESPAHAMVSPSLMGSCGVVPLTVISTIPDIVRHMSNVIVRAEREVFLATNYWQDGAASKFITNAMRELDKRAGKRGVRVVMKVIYDRGNPKQVFDPHQAVPEKEYVKQAIGFPPSAEIPNIDLQVVNYHRPIVGTFHSKYMVVDRKIAILQSNNIQDNDNVEMMIHLEGPIVDSFYDMALISWHKQLKPPLPSHNSPAVDGGVGSFNENHSKIFGPDGSIQGHTAIVDPAKMVPRKAYGYETGRAKEPGVVEAGQGPKDTTDVHRADTLTGPTTTASTLGPANANSGDGHDGAVPNGTVPSANLENGSSQAPNRPLTPDPPTKDFLNTGEQPRAPEEIRKASLPQNQPAEHTGDDPHYDADIAGEVARVQASVSAKPGETQLQAVTRHLNHTTNAGFAGDAPAWAAADEMTPYVPHAAHAPFPVAMVNRSPYGTPTHRSVLQPQNAAWLAALRNARRSVFVQSPTLNAAPLLPAIREACERGVDVYCYICLGYNDTGELLPHQNGHNEMIAHNLHKELSAEARQRLHYFWYVAKDQTRPIVQARKRRSCHIKLMIVDEAVGIMGNGNQDTQSWFHSQEINVMLDSPEICKAWIDALRRNQNTHLYGALDKDEGVWRDADGKEAEGATGVDPGRFSWAKGLMGAVKRVQGTGGF